MIEAFHAESGARLLIAPLDVKINPGLEQLFASNDYGMKCPSLSACWALRSRSPLRARWAIVPLCPHEAEEERLGLIESLRAKAS
jgi:hypothetical protein